MTIKKLAWTLGALGIVIGGCAAEADDPVDDDDSTGEEIASAESAVRKGTCSMKEIRENQRYCRAKCPRGSRGVKSCYRESDQYGTHAVVNCACK